MKQNNRKELYSISNQMIDIFIQDIFTKNNTNLNNMKANISEEQRETLRDSVQHLQNQVENFIYEQQATKKISEKDQPKDDSVSPLRKKFFHDKEEGDITENMGNTEE